MDSTSDNLKDIIDIGIRAKMYTSGAAKMLQVSNKMAIKHQCIRADVASGCDEYMNESIEQGLEGRHLKRGSCVLRGATIAQLVQTDNLLRDCSALMDNMWQSEAMNEAKKKKKKAPKGVPGTQEQAPPEAPILIEEDLILPEIKVTGPVDEQRQDNFQMTDDIIPVNQPLIEDDLGAMPPGATEAIELLFREGEAVQPADVVTRPDVIAPEMPVEAPMVEIRAATLPLTPPASPGRRRPTRVPNFLREIQEQTIIDQTSEFVAFAELEEEEEHDFLPDCGALFRVLFLHFQAAQTQMIEPLPVMLPPPVSPAPEEGLSAQFSNLLVEPPVIAEPSAVMSHLEVPEQAPSIVVPNIEGVPPERPVGEVPILNLDEEEEEDLEFIPSQRLREEHIRSVGAESSPEEQFNLLALTPGEPTRVNKLITFLSVLVLCEQGVLKIHPYSGTTKFHYATFPQRD